MAKVGEFLNKMATSAGVSQEDEALKTLLTASALSDVDIPDELVTKINSGYLTVESAKNNPEVAKHYKATILSGVDKNVNSILDSSGLPSEKVEEIKGLENSFEKINQTYSAIQEHLKAAAEDGGGEKVNEALKSENEELRQKLTSAQSQIEETKTEYEKQIEQRNFEFADDRVLSSIKYADSLSPEDYKHLTKNKVQQALNEKSLVPVLSEGGDIKLKRKQGDDLLDYFEDNKAVAYKDFVEKIATDNKFTQVSDPNPKPSPTPPSTGGEEDGPDASEYQAKINERSQEYEQE